MAEKSGRKQVSLPEAPALPKWKIKESHIVFFLLMLALSTRLPFLEYPPYVVFDETHYGKLVSSYLTGKYSFHIHPPLANLLIFSVTALAGPRPEFDFAFSTAYPQDIPVATLRVLPAIIGSLLVPLIYLVSRELLLSRKAAFLAAMMVLFDNALLSVSRLILIDIFVVFFSLLAFYLYLAGKKYSGWKGWALFALSGVAGGAAAASKWTGLAVVGFLMLLEITRTRRWNVYSIIKRIFVLLLIPLLVFFSTFAVHFTLLYKSGPGDAFMSDAFKKTLIGSQAATDARPLNMMEKFAELSATMLKSYASVTEGHPYASRFYTWPFMHRPIYMWARDNAHIYMLGNPAVWYLAMAALIAAFSFLNPVMSPGTGRDKKKAMLIILGFYLSNLLPFILVSGLTFIYHYLPAFAISAIVAAMVLDNILFSGKNRYGFAIYVAIIVIMAITFLYFSSLTYGFPLTNDELNARMWLPSWR